MKDVLSLHNNLRRKRTVMKVDIQEVDMTATEIARLVNAKEISPRETIEAAIERIETLNPQLNAISYAAFDNAREAAARLEKRIVRGEQTGPLAGVPLLNKDAFSAKEGWPCSAGLKALRERISPSSTNLPKRTEAADGIFLGNTNSPVFGFRGTTDSVEFGPAHNVFDLDRNAGGSSGGSAAAVASGMVPIAVGTDGGGSIRIPSSWSGVFGFQPSPGRLPFPLGPDEFGPNLYLYEGPITRNVADAALVMSVVQGFDGNVALALTDNVDFLGSLKAGVKGKKIGFTIDYGIFPVQAEVAAIITAAVQIFESLGAEIEPVDLRIPHSQHELSDVWNRLMAIGVHETLKSLESEGLDLRKVATEELPEPMMRWVDMVPRLTVEDLIQDQRKRQSVFGEFAKAFERYDYIVAPTLACLPVHNQDDGFTQGPTSINGEEVDPLIGWCMTYLTNFIGHPSASIPAGMSGGLPVGMQIMGRRGGDFDVMAASAAFEEASPWKSTYQRLDPRLARR